MSYPKASHKEYGLLKRLLSDGKWHKQNELEKHIGGVMVRQVCNTYAPEFVSLPEKGYALSELIAETVEGRHDIQHAICGLRSRARSMTERADKTQVKYPDPQRGLF